MREGGEGGRGLLSEGRRGGGGVYRVREGGEGGRGLQSGRRRGGGEGSTEWEKEGREGEGGEGDLIHVPSSFLMFSLTKIFLPYSFATVTLHCSLCLSGPYTTWSQE